MPSRPLVALLVTAFAPGAAQAAGYYFTDSGARANARGSAVVASVDDLSALYHNPGALARLSSGQVYLNFTGVTQYVEFDRAGEDEDGNPYEPVYNEAQPMLVPGFGLSGKFGLPNTTFALGFISPQAPTILYPEDGPQRHVMIEQELWEFAGVAGVGHQVTDWLAFGACFQARVLRTQQRLALTTAEGDDPVQDIDIDFEMADWFAPGFNAGVLIDPADFLTIGVSYQHLTRYDTEGTISADFEGHVWESQLNGTLFEDDYVTAVAPMPAILRAGIDFHPSERADIELAGAVEFWKVMQEVVITDLDLSIEMAEDAILDEDATVTNDIIIPAGFQNVWSVRLGGRYDFGRWVTWRLGGFYETSAIPPETQGVSLVDGNKLGYGTGGTLHLGTLDVDLAFAQTFLLPRDITDSERYQLWMDMSLADPEESEIKDGEAVGNGHFASHLTFFTAALTWRFGDVGKGKGES